MHTFAVTLFWGASDFMAGACTRSRQEEVKSLVAEVVLSDLPTIHPAHLSPEGPVVGPRWH